MNKKKKILIATGIFTPDIGGPASYVETIAEGLSKDIDVTILSYSSLYAYKNDSNKHYNIVRVWRKVPKPIRQILYFLKAFWYVMKNDMVYAMGAFGAGVPVAFLAKFLNKPLFIRIAGDSVWEKAVNSGKTTLLINDFQKSNRSVMLGILHGFQVWACNQAVFIAVPSKYIFGIVKGWGISEEKIRIVHNSIGKVENRISSEDARKKLGIPGKIILTSGRLVPWKGFRFLIKIMPQILEINPFFRLVIVGDGPEEKHLKAMVKNLGMQQKVFLVGRKSKADLSVYMSSADVFLLNTGYEGFSHQIIETMSYGVPVITTNMGGNREIINQGVNGFMVKYNDEFNFIEALKTLYENEKLRESFSIEGQKTASEYMPERTIEDTHNFLNI